MHYNVVRPAVQIGLLDFTLFPEYPEFYSTYQFMNIKNHTIYSDKMRISVLNLTRRDLATEKDKESNLHHWASFFKATTWEELDMLARKDESIKEAVTTIYQLSQEEQIRLQCEAREDYYRRQRTVQHHLDMQKDTIESQNVQIESQNATIEKQNVTIQNQNAVIENQNSTIRQLTAQAVSQEEEITSLKNISSSQQKELISMREEIESLKKLLSGTL